LADGFAKSETQLVVLVRVTTVAEQEIAGNHEEGQRARGEGREQRSTARRVGARTNSIKSKIKMKMKIRTRIKSRRKIKRKT
jgi:hypothetical protein